MSFLTAPNVTRSWVVLLCLLSLSACGDDDAVADTGGGDTGMADSAPDGDTGAGDADPSDTSPDTGPGDTGPADTGPDLSCTDDGVMRVADCGMCGTQSQLCSEGVWMPQSMCLGEGECLVGEVDTEETEACGERQRICLDGCTWGEWSRTREDGVCVPGATQIDPDACGEGEPELVTCDDECEWAELTEDECMTPCGPREDHGPLANRACVPAGTATLFYEVDGEERTRTPDVSAFWIDRYPVSAARYQLCVDAGECEPAFRGSPDDPTFAQRLDIFEVDDYCEFVGGSVPTLAQFVRAARGDCELRTPYPWSDCTEAALDDEPDCSTVIDCDAACASAENSFCSSVNTAVTSSSPFLVQRLVGPGKDELVRDLFSVELSDEYNAADPDVPSAVAGAGSLFRESLLDRQMAFGASAHEFRCVWGLE